MDIVWPSFDPEWRIWGLVGWPIDPWYVPGWLCLNMRDTSPAEALLCSEFSAVFFCILFSVFYTSVSLSFAEWDWGAAASDRGRRYCVKGSASTSQLCMCIYVAGLPGSIQALRLNIFWQEKLGLSSTYMYPIYIHRYTHTYMLSSPFLTTSLVNSCPRNSAAANKHTGNWINHGIQCAPPIILNKPLGGPFSQLQKPSSCC